MPVSPSQLATDSGAGAAAVTALGTNTVIVRRSPPPSALVLRVLRRESRVERYRLQATARHILPKERISVCLRVPAPLNSPHLKYSPARKSAHLGGLMRCGSPWSCPVCAAVISERRRGEVAKAIEWAKAAGYQVVLSTFTLRHGAKDSLESSLTALTEAYRRMHRRRDFAALRSSYGLSHSIKGLEATYGSDHGWHPHLHVLQFVSPGLDVDAYSAALAAAWLPSVASEGFSATARRGVDVKATWGHVAQYVTKLGRTWGAEDELAKANSKRGRAGSLTPMDLLRSAADTDDQADAARFREFALAMKRKHQLQWTRGLKAAVGIEDRSDEDLAYNWLDDDEFVYVLARLDRADWAAVRYCGPEAIAELETAGDARDHGRIAAHLAECRRRYFADGWGF